MGGLRSWLGILVGMTLALGPAGAGAEPDDPAFVADPFMKDLKRTAYASNAHLGFSLRASAIHWLGGVPIADERERAAARRDGWWGRPVPVLPPEMVPSASR